MAEINIVKYDLCAFTGRMNYTIETKKTNAEYEFVVQPRNDD